jgi:hypothetical protein
MVSRVHLRKPRLMNKDEARGARRWLGESIQRPLSGRIEIPPTIAKPCEFEKENLVWKVGPYLGFLPL